MSRPLRGRPPVEHRRVFEALIGRLAGGRYAPGSRIPTYSELMCEFGCQRTTICAVVTSLVGSGHLETRGRQGTFVTATPPCRARLALLLPRAENEDSGFSCYWRSLADAAAGTRWPGGYAVEVFTGPRVQAGSLSYLRLLAELEQHRIGGLILVATPPMYARTPIQQARIPQVHLCEAQPGHLCVSVDPASLRRHMLAEMAAAGARRPLLVGGSQRFGNRGECALWLEQAQAAGLEMREEHLLGIDIASPVLVERLVRLLYGSDTSRPPDGILIADDNLLEACQRGLAAAGRRIGEDLQVVAHLNRPTRLPIHPRVRTVSYDTAAVLQAAIDLIQRRQGDAGLGEAALTIAAALDPCPMADRSA